MSRSVVVGLCATAGDISLLTLLVKGFGLTPQVANVPCLFLGSNIQFWGQRHFVFKASKGSLLKQAAGFASIEIVGFCINATIYHCLVTYTSVNFLAARLVGSFLVFACYSYPMWRWNFKRKAKTT